MRDSERAVVMYILEFSDITKQVGIIETCIGYATQNNRNYKVGVMWMNELVGLWTQSRYKGRMGWLKMSNWSSTVG